MVTSRATAATTPSRYSMPRRANAPRGRRVDVAAKPASPLGQSGCSIANSLTFGAVDVSWTPPLRNVSRSDNVSTCGAGASLKPSNGLEPLTLKGVKTRFYSGCGSVVLVQEATEAVAALDVAVPRGRRRSGLRRMELESAVGRSRL